jgi:hypothetical protein
VIESPVIFKTDRDVQFETKAGILVHDEKIRRKSPLNIS